LSRVGFATTIPLKCLIAAGKKPVDLNNLFISKGDELHVVEDAEMEGIMEGIH